MKYPENPQLFSAVVADVENDAPRLVYADWLEDHGDAERAAFIRVQCALADKSPADPDYVDLCEQKLDILPCIFRHSMGPILPPEIGFHDNPYEEDDDSGAGYHRGFPYFAWHPDDEEEGIDAAKRYRDALPAVIATTTLRGLSFHEPFSAYLPDILASPASAHLSAIAAHVYEDEQTLANLQSLVTTAIAPNLQWLDQHSIPSNEAAAILTKAKSLKRMRRLETWFIRCDAAALKRLMAASWFGGLKQIGLRFDNQNAEVGVEGLGKLPELHTLDLWDLQSKGANVLGSTNRFRSLGSLSFHRAALQGKGVHALSKAKMPKLACLSLLGCELRNDDMTLLCKSDLFGKLRVLSLHNNGLGDKGVSAIANSTSAAILRVLRLGENNYGKGGLTTLSRPGAFPALTTLDLHSSVKRKASADEMTRFLQELHLPQLRHLDLANWPVDDRGAKAIADNPTFANLTRLNLGYCQIKAKGAAALFSSPHLRNLIELDMPYNKIGKAGEALIDSATLPNLRRGWFDIPNRLQKRIGEARDQLVI